MPLHSNILEQNVKSDNYIKTIYGRIIRKPDRPKYEIINGHLFSFIISFILLDVGWWYVYTISIGHI